MAALKLPKKSNMKYRYAKIHAMPMKGKTHDLNHYLIFSAHTIYCVCYSISSMFRALGIYNFGTYVTYELVFLEMNIIKYILTKYLN